MTFYDMAGAYTRADAVSVDERPHVLKSLATGAEVTAADGTLRMEQGHFVVEWGRESTTITVGGRRGVGGRRWAGVRFVRPRGATEWSAVVRVRGDKLGADLRDAESFTTDFRVLTGSVPRLATLEIAARRPVAPGAREFATRRLGAVMNT